MSQHEQHALAQRALEMLTPAETERFAIGENDRKELESGLIALIGKDDLEAACIDLYGLAKVVEDEMQCPTAAVAIRSCFDALQKALLDTGLRPTGIQSTKRTRSVIGQGSSLQNFGKEKPVGAVPAWQMARL